MSIRIIFGATGSGKTSLNAYFLKTAYRTEGLELLQSARSQILHENKTRSRRYTLPEKPPIYSDFRVRFLDGYEKYYEPYYLNGYYFGVANEDFPPLYVPPGSKIFLSEGQRYFDSRKSSTFPSFVSAAFEQSRHYMLDITIDVQRLKLIDLNIRELCRDFIEVEAMQHVVSPVTGEIQSTTFYCREWGSLIDVENYIETGAENYERTRYVNEGNIFECFDSYGHYSDFLPPEGQDFSYLPFLGRDERAPKGKEIYYRTGEPDGYRRKKKEEKE